MAVLGDESTSAEDWLALPDDGIARMVIQGEIWERPWQPKDRWHARANATISTLLQKHLKTVPKVGGEVMSSCDCFVLRRSPDTVIPIDIAYLAAATVDSLPESEYFVEGIPDLAIEIIAMDDTFGEMTVKVQELIVAGTSMVWVVDPRFETVTVYRPDRQPTLFSGDDVVPTCSTLPGLAIPVSKMFRR